MKFFIEEIKEVDVNDVMNIVYPTKKGCVSLEERMERPDGSCILCKNTNWLILSKERGFVIESGKPLIECLYCGYTFHL